MKPRKMLYFMAVAVTFSLRPFQAFPEENLPSNIEGIWLGTLKVPGAELRIAVTFSKDASGSWKATMNSLDQGSGELPMDEVKFESPHLYAKLAAAGIEFEGDVDPGATVWNCEFRQGPAKFPLAMNHVDQLPEAARPQEPKRPFPYHEEEVRYVNHQAGISLAGTLTFPESEGPFPAVILLTGSGAQNRDEEVFGHKPFLVLSDFLTRHGFAVLRSDDRGTGESGGSFQGSTTLDFAEDALAAVQYLKTRHEINADLIGLIGHSEGGMIAPLAAAQSKDIAFIVLMAGVGVQFDDIILHQKELRWKAAGLSEETIAVQSAWHNKLKKIELKNVSPEIAAAEMKACYDSLSTENKTLLNRNPEMLAREIQWMNDPWHRFASRYNAVATLSRVTCPVLAINGSKDTQVRPDENLAMIEKGLQAGGNKNYTIKKLEGLNHLFQTADTGLETEYTKIEETMSPDAMQLIADWLKEQVELIKDDRGRRQ
jgi:pimeloyl-ACP methyl ester carboxylesterase